MSKRQTRDKAIQMVKRVLIARRNGRPKAETLALEALESWCAQECFDMALLMDQVIAWLKRNDIAASMNGWV